MKIPKKRIEKLSYPDMIDTHRYIQNWVSIFERESAMEEKTNHDFHLRKIRDNVQSLIEEKKFNRAAEILKEEITNNPNQPEYKKLYAQVKHYYKKEKIQRLQEQAVIFLSTGDEERAQQNFREIYRLDPTRTDLKDSFKKTRKEAVIDYERRVANAEIISTSIKISCLVVFVLCSISAGFWIKNNSHLRKAEDHIVRGELENARLELKKCGSLFCFGRKEAKKKLQNAIDDLVSQANKSIEANDFSSARSFLYTAQHGTENESAINEKIKNCDLKEQQWKDEVARQIAKEELKKKLTEQANAAKDEYEKTYSKFIEFKSEPEARIAIESAKAENKEAEELFINNDFEAAQKKWVSANEECLHAIKITEGVIFRKNQTLVFKSQNDICREAGRKINAPAEANEGWVSGIKLANQAEQNFNNNNLEKAASLWQQSTDKFNEAMEKTKSEPNYIKAMKYVKKWSLLKAGLTAENIHAFYGYPKGIQTDSEKSIWYFQSVPEIRETPEGNHQYLLPESGYICFASLSINDLIARHKEAFQKQLGDENKVHDKTMAEFRKRMGYDTIRNPSSSSSTRNVHTAYRSPTNKPDYSSPQTTTTTPMPGTPGGTPTTTYNGYKNEEREIESPDDRAHNNWSFTPAMSVEEKRHQERLTKLKDDYKANVDDLVNGLTPREPKYTVLEWKEPDANNLICFMTASGDVNETVIKPLNPDLKWQIPARWRNLKLNIKEDDVINMLGMPDDKVQEEGKLIYHYGKVTDYGIMVFENCHDSINRLRYWKEPLWVCVQNELTDKIILSANPPKIPAEEEPNKPAI